MALVPDFRKDTVSADGVYCYLTDYTGNYATGGNPARNTLAIAMKAYKVSEDLTEAPMVVASYNPQTVTQFQITNTVDGWIKFYVVLVPKYTTTVTPVSNRYDLVYDTVTAAYYTYINTTPTASTAVTNPVYWAVTTTPTSVLQNIGLTNQTNNISYQIVNSVNTFQIEKCYIKIGVQVAKEICDCGCDGLDTNKTYKLYTQLDATINAVKIDAATQLYIAAERACVQALTWCSQCTFC